MRFFRSESGASIIEFAIVLPLLALLAIGVVDVGRWAYYGIVAANGARAGAQYGSQDLNHASDTTGIANAVNQENGQAITWTTNTTPLCSINGGALATCPASSSKAPQNTIYYVKVQVTGTFNPLLHYPLLRSQLAVSGSSILRLVNQ